MEGFDSDWRFQLSVRPIFSQYGSNLDIVLLAPGCILRTLDKTLYFLKPFKDPYSFCVLLNKKREGSNHKLNTIINNILINYMLSQNKQFTLFITWYV